MQGVLLKVFGLSHDPLIVIVGSWVSKHYLGFLVGTDMYSYPSESLRPVAWRLQIAGSKRKPNASWFIG